MINCVTGVLTEGTENRRWHTMESLISEVKESYHSLVHNDRCRSFAHTEDKSKQTNSMWLNQGVYFDL